MSLAISAAGTSVDEEDSSMQKLPLTVSGLLCGAVGSSRSPSGLPWRWRSFIWPGSSRCTSPRPACSSCSTGDSHSTSPMAPLIITTTCYDQHFARSPCHRHRGRPADLLRPGADPATCRPDWTTAALLRPCGDDQCLAGRGRAGAPGHRAGQRPSANTTTSRRSGLWRSPTRTTSPAWWRSFSRVS